MAASAVAWWDEHALPRLVDVALADRTAAGWRTGVCGDLAGEVLEIGFGSGRNLPFYGEEVCRVLAVEPSDLAWQRAAGRIAEFGRPVERLALDAARIPLPDASVDSVVATWVMCTIPDLQSALGEVRRVLRPGGLLHFVEHSLAPGRRTADIQRRLQPFWGPVAGGCHLDRDIPEEIRAAGLDLQSLHAAYVVKGWPVRPFGYFVTGRAAP